MQLLDSLRRNTLGIALFAIVTAALIATTYVTTRERIAANRQAQQTQLLRQIIPAQLIENDLLDDTLELPAAELGYPQAIIYRARKNGQVSAVVLPVLTPDGYSGTISLLCGVYADGRIAGVRVLQHQETPGLGDKIELKKSPWILSFNGLAYHPDQAQRWAVAKDGGQFDQFTGATITPRAVVTAVKTALIFFNTHQTQLLTDHPTVEATYE